MKTIPTQSLSPTAAHLEQASSILQDGGLVAFPTETVYGLGADASNDHAVAKIYHAKGRPQFNPLIVHVADVQTARRFVQWSDLADQLAKAFWPGPLTLVLPRKKEARLSDLLSAGLPTIAIRVPNHPVAKALLEQFGGAVAAPSANPSGQISPTSAAHVRSGLEGRIDAIVDAGLCTVGLESTIIRIEDTTVLLRPGGVAAEDIENEIGRPVHIQTTVEKITAPGQLQSHYAPRTRVRLNAENWRPNEARLGFGAVDCDLNLSTSADLIEAAANLFGHLHRLDAEGKAMIAVSPIPQTGLGMAINDRLQRAAAPR